LWLISLQRGFAVEEDLSKSKYFERLRSGLASQFLDKVLVSPSDEFPNYRTNNFMDGYNGIYRYNYSTLGSSQGYGAYELSSAMFVGFWSFLPNQRMEDVYCFIASHYPLNEKEIAIYSGPGSSRDRHPLFKSGAGLENGLLELIDRLACEFQYEFSNVLKNNE
jgi:hypothetical protein